MKALLRNGDLVEELKQRRVLKTGKQKVYSPPELQAYIDNLRHLSENDPVALIAYVSAMYGAIMAGGAMIKRMVKKAYSIKNEEGVQIFIIDVDDKFPNSKKVSNEMKRIINVEMTLSEDEKKRIISESSKVFARNNALVATVQNTAVFATATRHCLLYFGTALLGVFLAIYAFA
jgi:heme oxygenase